MRVWSLCAQSCADEYSYACPISATVNLCANHWAHTRPDITAHFHTDGVAELHAKPHTDICTDGVASIRTICAAASFTNGDPGTANGSANNAQTICRADTRAYPHAITGAVGNAHTSADALAIVVTW